MRVIRGHELGRNGEIRLTYAALGLALLGFLAFLFLAGRGAAATGPPAERLVWGAYVVAAALLTWGAVAYIVCRLGYLRRSAGREREDAWALERRIGRSRPSVVVMVPSYREEPAVVRQTLISAALLNHRDVRIVLLIDDPPDPADAQDRLVLRSARRLPREVAALLEAPRRRVERALDDALARHAAGVAEPAGEARALAAVYRDVADWFAERAGAEGVVTHADRHFVDVVLRRPERDLRSRAALLVATAERGEAGPVERHLDDLDALAGRFRRELSYFERKRFANLSHAPNKAMNLNAYIGLLGTRRRIVTVEGLRLLVPARAGQPGDLIPDADYILTLDADSIVDGEYAMRLLDVMERPGNERIAVAQTPYCAVPRAPGALERVAGATTDIQHLIHQGFTAHDATFWVGANALLRRPALTYIETRGTEEGVAVRRFIQDRTVIEDTESSVDLIARGWRLYNHPERLAWSATPPDFGALVIQRRRWANGGLIILPKLVRHLLRQRRLGEAFLRTHYLASIAVSSLAVLVLVALPIPNHPATYALPLAAVPFIGLYARDLRQLGYRRRDVVNVYALNLLLLPVNLGGVLMSLRQAVSGRKIPFGRTPKVPGRTAVPAVYVAAALAGIAGSALLAERAIAEGRWHHGVYAALTCGLLGYAVVRFIGVRPALSDLVRRPRNALPGPPARRLMRRLRPPAGPRAAAARR